MADVCLCESEGGMIRLGTLIELKFSIQVFRAQNYKFEFFELIILLKFDKQLAVERFEATGSQSTVSSPSLNFAAWNVREHVYVCMYVCMYACIYVMYVIMHVCM